MDNVDGWSGHMRQREDAFGKRCDLDAGMAQEEHFLGLDPESGFAKRG
jgi:hypothetical protein